MITMFNNNLKSCREDLEMSQSELGFVFGVSKQTVSGWENGHDTMPFCKVIKFSNLYGYSLDYIFGFTRKNVKYSSLDISCICSNLKLLRRKNGLSQQKIADECGIAQTTYSGYESGTHLINTMTIYTICVRYKVSADWIVGRCKNMYLKRDC